MSKAKSYSAILLYGFISVLSARTDPLPGRHVVVFREADRFGGWPANHGIWSWGDEILVGFEVGHFRNTEKGHAIDYTRPAEHVLARSMDGGETWRIERPEGLKPPPGEKVAGVPTGQDGREPVECPGGIDFSNPDFCLTARMTGIHAGNSRFYYSLDRGRVWRGPFKLPNFGQPGTAARTDYLVEGKQELMMFLTAAKSDGMQGRTICVRTSDGGASWKLVSFVGPEPETGQKAIMPSTVRLSKSNLLTARRQIQFIDTYRSSDNGATWEFAGIAVPDTGRNNGNPPHMIRLGDGRLVITYGFRSPAYGIRARISADEGKAWGPEIVLRADGGCWDLGYTRTVQRADGRLVTVYYFNDAKDGERYIAATIWHPDSSR
jgi:hypothetical protein